jgi:leucyl aminopeptidase
MLDITWTPDEPPTQAGQTLAIPLQHEHDTDAVTERFGAAVAAALSDAPFRGKPGERFTFTRERDGSLERVTLIGVGSGLTDAAAIRTFAHDAVRDAQSVGCKRLVVDLRWRQGGDAAWSNASDATHGGNLLAQGFELGTYAYERFLSEDKRAKRTLTHVVVWSDSTAPDEGTRRGQIVAAAVARGRDLANGPAELVTPSFLADTAQQIVDALSKDQDVSLTVLEREDCEKRSMGCYLAVARGSDQPPKFIHLRYRPKGQSRGRICLVGKGVTFDSGGYSLKPTDGMLDMKMDMAGAAAVIAAFEGAAKLALPWEVHAIVAATENMVSGRAYKLGDVFTASNGKTVEINNTDAEGRLTLADALVYARELQPDFVIDFATLTGACIVALGPKIAGMMTKDEPLAEAWLGSAERSGESMWRLPLPDDLKEQLKSKIADMKNTGERWGGALTAGLFLSEFTEGLRWMHVDIAGPAMASKGQGVTTPGGTGFPVATILELLAGDPIPAASE